MSENWHHATKGQREESKEPRRYFVTIQDDEGTLWLDTGSFRLTTVQPLLEFVQQAIQLAKDAERVLYRRESDKDPTP